MCSTLYALYYKPRATRRKIVYILVCAYICYVSNICVDKIRISGARKVCVDKIRISAARKICKDKMRSGSNHPRYHPRNQPIIFFEPILPGRPIVSNFAPHRHTRTVDQVYNQLVSFWENKKEAALREKTITHGRTSHKAALRLCVQINYYDQINNYVQRSECLSKAKKNPRS